MPDASARDGCQVRDRGWRTLAGIVALVLTAYLPALPGDFVIDDEGAVVQNPRLVDPDGLRRIWFSTESEQYQPLSYTSFWVERRIWGLRPVGYHLVNVALHAANAVLVWSVLRRAGVRGAAVAAAVFALHPVNVESVAWIYERKNVLSGLFFLLALGALLRFEERRRGSWYAAALLLFVAALLAKASTVVLPAMLLLYGWWRGTLWRRQNLAVCLPFFVLSGAMAVLTIWYERHCTGAVGAAFSSGFAERFARAGWITLFYVRKAFVPYPLMLFYPRGSVDPSRILSYLPHAALVVVLSLLIAKRRSWGRPALLGLGWYLIALLPVLGFFDVYYFRLSFVADHFQYLGLIGLVALVVHAGACGLDRLGRAGTGVLARTARTAGWVPAAAILAACWGLTWERAQVYRDTQALCEDTLRRNPNSWVAHQKLGEHFLRENRGERQRLELAVTHLERASQIEPEQPLTLQWVGNALRLLGRSQEAVAYLQRAVAADRTNALAHLNLGVTLEQCQRTAEAILAYQDAVRHGPSLDVARLRLGDALIRSGRVDEGLRRLQEAVDLRPDTAVNRFTLGIALCAAGRLGEGIPHLREAIRLDPDNPRAAAALREMERREQAASSAPAKQPL